MTWAEVIEKLEAWKADPASCLEDGWTAPTREAIEEAFATAEKYANSILPPDRTWPTANGGLCFEWLDTQDFYDIGQDGTGRFWNRKALKSPTFAVPDPRRGRMVGCLSISGRAAKCCIACGEEYLSSAFGCHCGCGQWGRAVFVAGFDPDSLSDAPEPDGPTITPAKG